MHKLYSRWLNKVLVDAKNTTSTPQKNYRFYSSTWNWQNIWWQTFVLFATIFPHLHYAYILLFVTSCGWITFWCYMSSSFAHIFIKNLKLKSRPRAFYCLEMRSKSESNSTQFSTCYITLYTVATKNIKNINNEKRNNNKSIKMKTVRPNCTVFFGCHQPNSNCNLLNNFLPRFSCWFHLPLYHHQTADIVRHKNVCICVKLLVSSS